MKYLRGSANYVVEYSEFPVLLKKYNDVNWIYDSYKIKSNGGYIFTIGGVQFHGH